MTEASARKPILRVASLAVLLALSLGTLAIGGWLTSAGRGDGWYESLRKPPFQPPDWVFGPVWTAIMALAGIAAWRVYESRAVARRRRTALALYGAQLLLNVGWSYLFFYCHRPTAALAELLIFDVSLAAMVYAFSRVDRLAGVLLTPYGLWVIFATVLNGWIVAAN